MKKYFHFLIIKLFEKLSDWNIRLWDSLITRYYKTVRRKNKFILETKEIRVKKGKRKYTIVVCETPEGQVRFNLGRRESNSPNGVMLNPV